MRLTALLVLATSALASASAATSESANKRELKQMIQGGSPVPAGEKTWAVGLRDTESGLNICNGALITPTHVLTSSRCGGSSVGYAAVGSNEVGVGSGRAEVIRIVKKTTHPDQGPPNWLSNDLIIMELQRAATSNPVKVQYAAPALGSPTTILQSSAWLENGKLVQQVLQVTEKVYSQARCVAAYSDTVDRTMICSLGDQNNRACEGGLGAPMSVQGGESDALVGLLSWGDACSTVGDPLVYARVSTAKDWINSVTWNATTWV